MGTMERRERRRDGRREGKGNIFNLLILALIILIFFWMLKKLEMRMENNMQNMEMRLKSEMWNMEMRLGSKIEYYYNLSMGLVGRRESLGSSVAIFIYPPVESGNDASCGTLVKMRGKIYVATTRHSVVNSSKTYCVRNITKIIDSYGNRIKFNDKIIISKYNVEW
jgi:hypothetical protein